jgi:tRNA G10  N-methylase Trm11
MEEKKMLSKGDVVVDPFGGIGTTLLIGATLGYKCIGNELEEKFVKLTEANIEKIRAMLLATNRTIPIIIQGDSRKLSEIIQENISGIITSSPYGATQSGDVNAVITSPAYADISTGAGGLNTKPATKNGQQSGRSAKASSQDTDQKYGKTDGQIARLKDKGVDSIISSPPYADGIGHSQGKRAGDYGANTGYYSDGNKENIGNKKEGSIDSVITSPPFEDSIGSDDPKKRGGLFRDPKRANDKNLTGTYGKSEGQIGKEKAETYWEAMRLVYIECWKILKQDGYIAIVVKDFVRKRQIVPLCDNTAKLLESIGFKVEYRVRAWTLTDTVHDDLFLGEMKKRKERKSFFRRLSESKGSPRIDYEQVIIAKKI